MASILVTGGAGYIGSHTCKALRRAGFDPISYDNLSRGNPEAVQWGALEFGELTDKLRLREILARYRPAAVIHFAALAYVGEFEFKSDRLLPKQCRWHGCITRGNARVRHRQNRVFIELRGLWRTRRRSDLGNHPRCAD